MKVMPRGWNKIELTYHVKKRMVERKVSVYQIRLTLEQPDRVSNRGNDRRSFKRFYVRELVVAWHVEGKMAVIRTVFWQ